MRKTFIALALAAASSPLFAAEADYTLAGNFGLTSDYRYRGVSQTDLKPAVQGGIDYTDKSGFYLGNWNSSVSEWTSFNGAGIEMDFYGGYRFSAGDVAVDVGNLYYYYPGATGSLKPNTNEVYLSLGYGVFTLKTSYATTEYFGVADSDGTLYFDLTAATEISKGLTAKAHIGQVQGKGDMPNGSDYLVGLTWDLSGWAVTAAYVGTSGKLKDFVSGVDVGGGSLKDLGKAGLMVSVSKSF
ncbi:MAG: hypothetical protein RLY30_659 [Pseudomonadota bacterium]|jgi:uncharacterized protein (TIGR02001 family)